MILLHDLVLESLLAIHLIEVVHILTICLLRVLNTFLMNIFMTNIIRQSLFKNGTWSELFVVSEHHLFSLDEVALFFSWCFLLLPEFLFNLRCYDFFIFLRTRFVRIMLRSFSSLELRACHFVILALNHHKM